MVEQKSHVLVDTMIIIEAHRSGQWKPLCEHYKIDTVEKCVEEAETGNQNRRNPVNVDTATLNRIVKPKKISEKEIASLILGEESAGNLDDGEKHLLAYAMTLGSDVFFLCSPDKACMRVGHCLGMLDKFVSLEELLDGAGARAKLKDNYTTRWLNKKKSDIRLGILS